MPLTFAEMDALRARYRTDQTIPRAWGAEYTERLAIELAEQLWNDPLVQGYRSYHGAPGGRANDRAWLAMAEARYYAMMICQRIGQHWPVFGSEVVHHISEAESALGIALRLIEATPYLWRTAICQVSDAAPLPTHIIDRELLPSPILFFSWETDYHGETAQTNWALIYDDLQRDYPDGNVTIVIDVQPFGAGHNERGGFQIATAALGYSTTWPTDYQDAEPGPFGGVERIIKRLAFLRSPYTVNESSVPPRELRHKRRVQERKGRALAPAAPEEAHTIVLRRPTSGERYSVDPEATLPAGEERHYQHQWWVRAHHRAQWYPSRQAHQVIWIPPFLKGPADAPMIEHVYDVAH